MEDGRPDRAPPEGAPDHREDKSDHREDGSYHVEDAPWHQEDGPDRREDDSRQQEDGLTSCGDHDHQTDDLAPAGSVPVQHGNGRSQPEVEWAATEDDSDPVTDWCATPAEECHSAPPESTWGPPESSAPQGDRSRDLLTTDDAPPPDDFQTAVSAGPVPVEVAGSCGYVWTVDAARRLRQLGVPGQMTGGLPRAPRQQTQLGLPLALQTEEMALLKEQGLCELVQYPELASARPAAQRQLLEEQERASAAAQQQLMTLARHKQLLERADQIVDGKWRKLQKLRAAGKPAPDTSRQQLRFEFIEQLRASVKPPPVEQCYRQLYCAHPLVLQPAPADVPPPRGLLARTRRAAYADLWRRGYYLTDGLKFGGDFLAYEGDPLVYHAAFVVRCVARRPHVRDVAGMQRLAHGCGKTLLLSWLVGEEVRHEAVSRRPVELREVKPERAAPQREGDGAEREGDGAEQEDERALGGNRLQWEENSSMKMGAAPLMPS